MTPEEQRTRDSAFIDLLKMIVKNELFLRGKSLDSFQQELIESYCRELGRTVAEA